jgi:translation elongation factor EF-G
MGLTKGINNGMLVPLMMGSATKNIGVDRLLWLTRGFPSPLKRTPVQVHPPEDATATEQLALSTDEPFVALCFNSIIDPFVGPLSFFRVFTGTATTETHPTNSRTHKQERLSNLFNMVGKKNISLDKIVPGDIVAIPKLKNVHVGDIMGDMNQRRARISSMEGKGCNNVVKALVPLAEMLNYSPSLKSMTGGKGAYSMQFHVYNPVPSHMQDKLVKEVNRLKLGDDD